MEALKNDLIKLLKHESKKKAFVRADSKDISHFNKSPAVSQETYQNRVYVNQMPEIRKTVSKLFPKLSLTDKIPDDTEAKKRAYQWKEPIVAFQLAIISFESVPSHLLFLKNVKQAINTLLTPSTLVDGWTMEKEQKWDLFFTNQNLKGLLISSLSFWKSTSLIRFYRENSHTKEHFIHNIPVIFMEEIASYLKHPELKKTLWNHLKSQLSVSTLP